MDAKKKKRKPDDSAESRRFVEAAKSLDADESGQKFSRAINAVIPAKEKTRRKSRP